MVYSIIQKSQLEGAMRMDAEYYQPEYLDIVAKLKQIKCKTLEEISDNLESFGAYALTSQIVWRDCGIPFIVAENIKEGFIDIEGVRYIDEQVDEILKKSRVKEGQVLLSMSGSVGNAAVAYEIPSKLNSNQDIVKITLKKEYSPFFLAAFLNSRYGQKQVLRLPVGSVQQHIFLWQTKTILLPIFPNDEVEMVENVYRNSLDELKKEKAAYNEAENLLIEELGLGDFDFEKILSSVVNFSDVLEAQRMDAEYFQPKYEKIISKIKSQNHKRLGDLVSMKKGIEVGADEYYEEGKVFIRVSSLDKFEINDCDQKCLSDKLYEKLKADFEPKKGEILLTKDATPGIAHVVKNEVEGIISGGILRLKLKDSKVDNEYLALCLNSIVGKMQAERDAGGSVISHWKPEQIKNVVIPILPKETQQKIADLVRQSHEARKKAKELLEEAKRKVEEMIENK